MSEEQRLLFDVVPPVFARRLLRQLPGRTREVAVALLAEMARRGLCARIARKASKERTDED